jgi:hypothetical protein
MIRTISNERAEEIIANHSGWIEIVAKKYDMPGAVIRAILYNELTRIDLMDTVADIAVWSDLFPKKDSSTGYAQIFGRVGLNAVNFAVDRGLTTYEALGINVSHRLDSSDPDDVKIIWNMLHTNADSNIEIATLNILSAAFEMTGRLDFDSYSPEELKLILTRYNADTKQITPYGEEAYNNYLRYSEQ